MVAYSSGSNQFPPGAFGESPLLTPILQSTRVWGCVRQPTRPGFGSPGPSVGARFGPSRGPGTDDCRLAGDGFDDAERPCRLHHALQPEPAPPE